MPSKFLTLFLKQLELPLKDRFDFPEEQDLHETFIRHVRIVIEEQVPVCSFTFGIPPKEIITELKEYEIFLIGTILIIFKWLCKMVISDRIKLENREAADKLTNILSLGIVYDDSFGKPEELQNLMDLLTRLEGEPFEYKVSKDLEGENWVEGLLYGADNKLNYKLITDNFYGEIKMKFKNFWEIKELNLMIRFIEQQRFFGFLLEFDLDILQKFYSLEEIDELLINLSKVIYASTKYKYVFFDHDSEVDYSPLDYKEYVKAYSLVIIPKGTTDFIVIKNKWHIDGFTMRSLN